MKNRAASATSGAAQQAAEEILAKQGSAVDAVLAGFFASAATDAAVFFSPAILLCAGAGVSGRLFDGRALQPGIGLARPRGAVSPEQVLPAARAALPRAPHMALLAHSAFGRRTLAEVSRAGISLAREQHVARAEFMTKVVSRGALALRSGDFIEACLRDVGPHVGGLWSEQDMLELPVTDAAASVASVTASTGEEVRIVSDASLPTDPGALATGSVLAVSTCAAVDAFGQAAVLVSYIMAGEVVYSEALGIAFSPCAVPVRRGETRVPPHASLPVPLALAIATSGFSHVVAVGASSPRGLPATSELTECLAMRPVELGLRQIGEHAPIVAVRRHGDNASGWSPA